MFSRFAELSRTQHGATLAGIVAILFWSCSVGVIRGTIELLGPTGAPAVMFTAAALLLWPTRTSLRDMPRGYLWLGAALFVAYQLCFTLSLGVARSRHEAIEVGMVNYLWPSLTVLFSTLAQGRRANALMLAGLGLALLGVIAASSPPEGLSLARFFDNARANPLCYGLGLSAALSWSLYSSCTHAMARGKNGLWFFMALSAAAFWILHVFEPHRAPMRWNLQAVAMVALASAASTLGYLLWNIGVLHGRIHLLGLAANATPLLSALIASLLLSAPLAGIFWAGAALVAIGSLVARKSAS